MKFVMVCRSVADILMCGHAFPVNGGLDKCEGCGTPVSITESGRKRRLKERDVTILCQSCALKLNQLIENAGVEVGSPEASAQLGRSPSARQVRDEFIKRSKPL